MSRYKPNIIFLISILISILIHLIIIEKINISSFFKKNNIKAKEVEIEINIQEPKLNRNSAQSTDTRNVKKIISNKPDLSKNEGRDIKTLKDNKLKNSIETFDLFNKKNSNDIQNKIDTNTIISNISTFGPNSEANKKNSSIRIKKISSKSKDFMYKLYFESWKKKVERMGAMNYPESAKNSGIFGSLVITVYINSKGIIKKMAINKSSGKKDLDQAALDIVRMGEPYAKFPARMKKEVDIVTITRTWRFTKDNNFSSKN